MQEGAKMRSGKKADVTNPLSPMSRQGSWKKNVMSRYRSYGSFQTKSLLDQRYIMGETYEELFHKRRHLKLIFSFCSFLGLLSAIAVNELQYATTLPNIPGHDQPPSQKFVMYLVQACKFITVLSTVVAMVVLHLFTKARLHMKQFAELDDNAPPEISFDAIRRAGLLKLTLFELAVIIPQPIPFLTFKVSVYDIGMDQWTAYGSDEFLLLLMFFRLWRFPLLVAEYHQLSNPGTRAIGKVNSIKFSQMVVLKDMLNHHLGIVMFFFLSSVLVLSYMVLIVERPQSSGVELHNYFNCMWLIMMTMTTVGFGDIVPVTMLGRLVIVIAAMTALVMMALILNGVMERLSLSRQEAKVILVARRLRLERCLKDYAARTIQRMYRLNLEAKRNSTNENSRLLDRSTNRLVTHDVPLAIYLGKMRKLRFRSVQLAAEWHTDTIFMLSEVYSNVVALARQRGEEQSLSSRVSGLEETLARIESKLDRL